MEYKQQKKLKKELRLLDVYAIATGATLSSGFFLLPGIAAIQAGPALVLSYIIAGLPLIPAMFSIIELATAMPRAGGMYFFLDRTLGPLFGTIGGMGTWLALILKVSFALVGMGAYISLFFPNLDMRLVSVILAVALCIINILGAKKTGRFQILLVFLVLIILAVFIAGGLPSIKLEHFNGFFNVGYTAIVSTAGMVYISYSGVMKVASLSEEIKDPERNIPLGVILAILTIILIYGLGTTILVGVLPMEKLAGNLTPVASVAQIIFGDYGVLLLTIGAFLAFISVANAGTLSSSRYPLAMSRDNILPHIFKRISRHGTPYLSILLTVGIILLILIFLDPTGIAKLASVFQLLLFAMTCFSVIVIRESKIESYDPGFRSPFYPWMQIFGILVSLWLIVEMGLFPMLFSLGLIIAGTLWYYYYVRDKVIRSGAIYHIFARLGKQRDQGLDRELRGILKEKGLRKEDPFDEIIMRSFTINIEKKCEFEEMVTQAASWFSGIFHIDSELIKSKFSEGTRLGATPVIGGVALPHFRLDGIDKAEMVLVRSREGIHIKCTDPLSHPDLEEHTVFAMFFLISPEKDPTQHLRILAQIAGRVEDESFQQEWLAAEDDLEIKEALLHDDRFVSINIRKGTKSEVMIDSPLREIYTPVGSLVALLRRHGNTIIPNGNTIFEEGDRITIIGSPKSLSEVKKRYVE